MHVIIMKWWMIKLFKTQSFCAISLEINQWNIHCFTPVHCLEGLLPIFLDTLYIALAFSQWKLCHGYMCVVSHIEWKKCNFMAKKNAFTVNFLPNSQIDSPKLLVTMVTSFVSSQSGIYILNHSQQIHDILTVWHISIYVCWGRRCYNVTYHACIQKYMYMIYGSSHFVVQYRDVIMGAIASQIAGVSIVCSIVCNQRKHQRSASLAFVRGIHRW